MLPTYIIIGAMKCGTTSLHRYLSAHPQISASVKKELNFFKTEIDFAKGVQWYASQFDSTYSVRGEGSPNYTKWHIFPGVPQRMYSVVPDCKLIYIARNPIERAISHYLHNWSAGIESRPISEAFQRFENNNYILTGNYLFQLERFIEYYRQDQILVLLSEDLRDERQATLSRVFRFLGVDDAFVCQDFQQVHHRTSARRREISLVRLSRRYFPAMLTLARKLLPSSALGKLSTIAHVPVPSVIIAQELHDRLVEHYELDIQGLSRFLGGKTPNWFGKSLTSSVTI
jgi:Sulfotransferase domain